MDRPLLRWSSEAAFTPLWGFKRRIPALAWLAFVFPLLGVAIAARVSLAAGFLVPTIAFVLLHGVLGQWFLARSLRRRDARLAKMPDDARRAALARMASVGRVEHALLVLLCLPLTVLAILAADPGIRAAAASRPAVQILEADLLRLADAQRAHLADAGRYAESFAPWTFEASPGVNLRILYADALAFAADATLGGRPERCVLFVGEARGLPAGARAGVPSCSAAPAP